uniref:Putative salivary secreted protein n=1 Tax=Ornithodoros turicata TaxID=34597 RepID=A0A2R5LGC8_9ACAR
MKSLLAIVLLIVVCDAYEEPDSYLGRLEECSSGPEHKFDTLVAPACSGEDCFAFPGGYFHLIFSGKNRGEHYTGVSAWAHIQGIDHPEDAFYYSSGCQDDWTSYPCVAKPNENINGRLAIKFPEGFKKGLTRIILQIDGVGCGMMYIRVGSLSLK